MKKKKIICPICNSQKTNFFLMAYASHGNNVSKKKENFDYYICKECGAIFLQGEIINMDFYKKYYDFSEFLPRSGIVKILEDRISRYSISQKVKMVSKNSENKKKKVELLDVGCGTGFFLQALDKKRFNAFGIEIDKKEYDACKKKQLTVINGDILKENFGKQTFDVITLWHVVEHIAEPHKLFKKLQKLLKKDGLLIISTPNTGSVGFNLSKERWFHFDAPRHIILYCKRTMELVCKKNKFQVDKIVSESFEFPLDLFWSVKNSAKKNIIYYLLYPFFKLMSQETLTFIIRKSHEI